MPKNSRPLPAVFSYLKMILAAIFLFAVFAAVDLLFLISEDKDVRKLLLDGCDTAGIFAFQHIFDLFWERQRKLLHDLTVFDNVDSDVVIDKTYDVKVEGVDVALHFQDVFLAHFLASGVFDDRHSTVKLVKPQVLVDAHALAGFDMVKDEAFFDFSYI